MVIEKKFDTEIMDSISNKSRQITTLLSNAKKPDGKLLSSSLLGNGISKLDSAIKKASNRMNGMYNAISRQRESIELAEHQITSEIESISIPKKFDLSSFNPLKQEMENGEKQDQGKQIKAGNEINEEKFNEYVKSTEIELNNINKNRANEEQEYDSNSEINKELIDNINNEKETKEKDYRDDTTIKEKELKAINSKADTTLQELKDNISGNMSKLKDMNKSSSDGGFNYYFSVDNKNEDEKEYNDDDFYYLKDEDEEMIDDGGLL